MTYSRQIKALHDSIYKEFRCYALGGWRQWLECCQESAREQKKHERAYLIGDLIRFDIQQPGPHTNEELTELINENY